jgi:hypothetical protein
MYVPTCATPSFTMKGMGYRSIIINASRLLLQNNMHSYVHGTGIWSLHCGADDSGLDNTLVVSFVGQTTWVQYNYVYMCVFMLVWVFWSMIRLFLILSVWWPFPFPLVAEMEHCAVDVLFTCAYVHVHMLNFSRLVIYTVKPLSLAWFT